MSEHRWPRDAAAARLTPEGRPADGQPGALEMSFPAPLDVLILPWPAEPIASCDDCGDGHDDITVLEVSLRSAQLPPAGERHRAWYRWLHGHQLVFCVWRLLSETLAPSAVGAAIDETALDQAADLFDAYAALLVYTGSCTPSVYRDVIRPRMVAADPAFSGTWARDYEHVLAMLGRLVMQPASPLSQAVRRNRIVHMAVAKRLVPTGRSLLRDAKHRPTETVTDTDRRKFDDFFLTRRAPTCRPIFASQSIHRIARVLHDVDSYPIAVWHERRQASVTQDQLAYRLRKLAWVVSNDRARTE
jgi:L-tyrosine peroxygenase